MALLLGFVLPPNFDLPYLATSPIDFWRRWHLSLSHDGGIASAMVVAEA